MKTADSQRAMNFKIYIVYQLLVNKWPNVLHRHGLLGCDHPVLRLFSSRLIKTQNY